MALRFFQFILSLLLAKQISLGVNSFVFIFVVQAGKKQTFSKNDLHLQTSVTVKTKT